MKKGMQVKTALSCLFILLIFTSCTLPIKDHEASLRPDGVDLSLDSSEKKLSSDEQQKQLFDHQVKIQKGEETVRIGSRGGDIFVSSEDSKEYSINARSDVVAKLRVGISFGPGLNRVIGHISLLKFLEKNKIVPEILTGTEFGAIVAAMYASGMSPEIIEWNFYRYFKEKSNSDVYDENWIADVRSLLISKIKIRNTESTPKKLYLTLYNTKTKKTHYFEKGPIANLLISNFLFSGDYVTPIIDEVFNADLMRRLGADFAVVSDILGSGVVFQEEEARLKDQYLNAIERANAAKNKFDYIFEFPLGLMPLDLNENHGNYFLSVDKYLKNSGPKFSTKLMNKRKLISGQHIEEER